MSEALLPGSACFALHLPNRQAESPLPLRSIDAFSQGDRRPMLHHCPGIANRLFSSKPWKHRLSGADRGCDGPVRLSETWAPIRMKRTSVTLGERSLAHL